MSPTPSIGGKNTLETSIILFFVLSYYVSLCSEFRVVMSVMISVLKRCSVRLYLQLFVGGLMSCLRYLCVLAHGGIQHILCCVFVLFFLWMLPNSRDCRFDCHLGIL